MKQKKVLAVLLSLAMVVSMMPGMAFAANDASEHWAQSAFDEWAENGVLSGDENGNANLDNSMTRGELAQVLAEAFGYETTASNQFTDLNGQWYQSAILKCVAADVMSGYGDGTVGGDDPITREQSIVMLARALKIEPMTTGGTAFADSADVSSWALPYLNAMSARGIVNGNPDGTVDPLAAVSRGAVVVMLNNAVTTYINAGGTYAAADVDATGTIVIATAEDVVIEGVKAGDIIVAQGAANGSVTLNDTTADNVIVSAANGEVTVGKGSAVENVIVEEGAEDAALTVAGTVENISVKAPDTSIQAQSTAEIGTIAVEETADGTSVNVANGATIDTLSTDGADITATGNTSAIKNQETANGGTINAPATRPSSGGGGGSHGGGNDNPSTTNPDTTTTPGGGDTPTTPGGGDTPTTPGGGDTPTTPGGGDTPTTPEGGDTPTTPEGGDTPTTPEGGNTPTTSDNQGNASEGGANNTTTSV